MMVLNSRDDSASPSSTYAISAVKKVAVMVMETETETGIRKMDVMEAMKEPSPYKLRNHTDFLAWYEKSLYCL